MTCRKRILAYFHAILLIVLKIFRLGVYAKLIYKYFCRFGTNNDFILRIAPLRDKKHDSYRNYFPPPCYGFPYRTKSRSIEPPSEPYQKYGLFLWPDRLYQDISYFSLLLIATLVPFIPLFFYKIDSNYNFYYVCIACISLLIIAFFLKIIFIIFANKSLPVLHQIWALWPESHYSRFLTVPHISDLASEDESKQKNKYWKPDIKSPLSHQPSYYAKSKNTLQEVILHLAIFDYLFYPSTAKSLAIEERTNESLHNDKKKQEIKDKKKNKNKNKNKYKKSLKLRGWVYLFSPAIISYILLLIAFFVSAFFYPPKYPEGIPILLRYPFWYAPLIIVWFTLTLNMIIKQISFLENLQKEIHEGYYNAHLELIPQQILSVIAKIPNDEQISKGIEQVESILRWVQAAALVSFFILLEVFSSGFK